MPAINGLHLVRYGTPADQKFLLGEFLNTYDQLVINATMVAHAPAALASFLSQHTRNKPYFIDPQTHAFQHDIGHLESSGERTAGEIKRSVRNLLDAYGEPVLTCVGTNRTSILPEDFSDPGLRRDFCNRVIEFQTQSLTAEVTRFDAAKYYDFLRKKGQRVSNEFGPSLVVAPYFYFDSKTIDGWLPINIECARAALEAASRLKRSFAVQVVLNQDVLIQETVDDVVRRYSEVPPDVFLLWVDSLSEHDASVRQLRALTQLISGLAMVAPVVNLYGGFFSVALARSRKIERLIGVTHGLEYGEERGVVPVGGGIPVPKYYLPKLHVRLHARDAYRAIRALHGFDSIEAFFDRVCDCSECKRVIRRDAETDFLEYGRTRPVPVTRRGQQSVIEYPMPETKTHCVRHYMWSKQREYSQAFSLPLLLEDLAAVERDLGRVLGLSSTIHCRTWRELLGQ